MISRTRFNRTKLLYNTLTETLILFLFILLAIATIYNRLNGELKEVIENNEFIPPGHTVVENGEYEEYLKNKSNLAGITSEKDSLINEIKERDKKIEMGVGPPPCELGDDNQVLLEIDFIQDTTFLVTVVNIKDKIILNSKWTLKRDSTYVLNQREFKEVGFLLHESKRINHDDPDCEQRNNPRAWVSSYCYECVYVFKLVDRKKQTAAGKIFPWFSKSDIGSELTKDMIMIAQMYFYPTK